MNPKIADQIKSRIDQSESILLHLHPSADADSLGSALAMYFYLKTLNKKVTLISGDTSIPLYLQQLPGVEQIQPFNFFDIDQSQYDLFIILDSADLNQISKRGRVEFAPHLFTITIDHHPYNPKFSQLNYIDPNAPATCQIIYQLLSSWHAEITPSVAINLFLGIYHDTGGFKYDKTSPQTFTIASKLTSINPDSPKFIFEIENNNSREQLFFRGLALQNIQLFFSDQVAVSAISYSKFEKSDIDRRFTDKGDIANLLKSVTGWQIGACLVEAEPGVTSFSLRTRDAAKFDLAKLAATAAPNQGGGHPAAAGGTINLPLSAARKQLLTAIDQLFGSILG